jgi:hypothetical protein
MVWRSCSTLKATSSELPMSDCEGCRDLDLALAQLQVTEAALEVAQERVEKLRAQVQRLQIQGGLTQTYTMTQIAEWLGVGYTTIQQHRVRFASYPKPLPGVYPVQFYRQEIERFYEMNPGLGKRET